MRYGRLKKAVILYIVVMLLLSSMSVVFADTNIAVNASDIAEIQNAIKAGSAALVGEAKASSTEIKITSKEKNNKSEAPELVLLKYESGSGLTFSETAFKMGKPREVKKAMQGFIVYLQDSSISVDTQEQIMTSIQESDPDVSAMMIEIVVDSSKANLYMAIRILYPFLVVLRVVFGVGAVIIVLLLIFSTIIDLAYIGLPVWRESSQEKSGGKKPFGVSYEALSTVMEIEKSLGEYKNAYWLYGKRRATTYIVLGVCLLYLIVGEIGGLIGWVLSLVSGLM